MMNIYVQIIFVGVLVVAILVSLYNYGLENADVPVIYDFASRIEEKKSRFFL